MGLRVKVLLDQGSKDVSSPSPQPLETGVKSVKWLLDPVNQHLTGKFIIKSQVVNW